MGSAREASAALGRPRKVDMLWAFWSAFFAGVCATATAASIYGRLPRWWTWGASVLLFGASFWSASKTMCLRSTTDFLRCIAESATAPRPPSAPPDGSGR